MKHQTGTCQTDHSEPENREPDQTLCNQIVMCRQKRLKLTGTIFFFGPCPLSNFFKEIWLFGSCHCFPA